MKNELKPGDLVQLKSGGPVMTYEGEGCSHDTICSFFDGNKLTREGFPLSSLKLAEEPHSEPSVYETRGLLFV